jgi:thiamine-monophosphate kinase
MHSQSHSLGEFDLIERFFKTDAISNSALNLGIGDDCALLAPLAGEEMAITSDMLVEGRHFFAGADPMLLGRKALAVNLSDLAAMGAKPLGFTLAIALPKVDVEWLDAFSKGLLDLAKVFNCPLIGGDTTAGPLTISITAIGSLPTGKAIHRSGAMIGDDIWVSGTLGDARLTLAALRHELNIPTEDLSRIAHRMHQPTPRVDLGIQLRGIANAALDVSDGLLGDLKHILKASQVDAEILLEQLPKSETLKKQNIEIQNVFAASGGDDYELCFTAPKDRRNDIMRISQSLKLPLTHIGQIKTMQGANPQVHILNAAGERLSNLDTAALLKSFDHFAS